MKNLKYLAVLALGIVACESDLDNSVADGGFYSSGDADLTNYVAVGNSLTAGYADGALYIDGQNNSYPNIMAEKFSFVGGGAFSQPLMNDNLGGLLLGGTQIADNRLVLEGATQASLAPTPLTGSPTTEITARLSSTYNNMGVPGAKSFHLMAPGYGNAAGVASGLANPYYARFASSDTSTIIDDAAVQDPTFFSLWIGNNDVLSFATSGGIGVDQTGFYDPSLYGPNDITDPAVFAGTYQALLNQLTATGAKGVVMNLPSVTSIPYFITVPHNPIPMDAATAAGTNAAYAAYNGACAAYLSPAEAAKRTINFVEGQNPVVIMDETLTDLTGLSPLLASMRMATENDLIVLPARTVIGTLADPSNPASVIGVGVPLGDELVLIEDEVAMIANAQASYNATIAALASVNPDVILVDVKTMMEFMSIGGVSYTGGLLTSTYATGNAFSLDGVHPTARGYAYIANEIIKEMNSAFNATIPAVEVGAYPSVYFN